MSALSINRVVDNSPGKSLSQFPANTSMAQTLYMDCPTSSSGLDERLPGSLPSDEDAAKALSVGGYTRQNDGFGTQYGNNVYSQASTSSTKRSLSVARLQSPSPTLQSSISTRSMFLGSSTSVTGSRSYSKIEMLDVRINLICNWLHQKQLQSMWSIGENGEGVMVKKGRDEYACCPMELSTHAGGFYDAVKQLNVKCAMTINTRTTRLILELNESSSVPLSNGLRLQVIRSLASLPKCQKNHFAALVYDPPMLVVWDDDPSHIIERVQDLESQMMNIVWNSQPRSHKEEIHSTVIRATDERCASAVDVETAATVDRKTALIQPCIVSATLVIMFVALGAGWRSLAVEIRTQQTWGCLVFAAVGPLQAWMGLFFFQAMPTYLAQIVGPVRQMRQNSKFYSGKPPRRISGRDLPHVTVQCPVYKENLYTVIQPTIKSIEAAISTYEMQGGSANIFVNDDGLQLLPNHEAQERCDFYEEHSIGWVARPRHNAIVPGHTAPFIRAGKFKKASNMNYGLNVSVRLEDKLQVTQRSDKWTVDDERVAYQDALVEVIEEDAGSTWAAGNVRVGDYILLIDSDTRVPRDCLLDAISELEQSPQVAIIQFSSGVMNVTQSWFEKGITFFTNLVYTAIEFSVANGDVAPFVGHNAFLRWSAVQDVAYSTPDRPQYQQFWSEQTVSEDFDMALRLQTSGYILRHASYANGGFKEGVSLTVYDELARWEKYAFGCSELIFRPFRQWIFRGPFTPLFRRFLLSEIPFHSKISIMAYVGTYFAIASSWLLTLLNYFLVGWFNGYLDHYYVDSFKIYFSTIIAFNLAGNVALAVFRYRIKEKNLLAALMENFKWVPFLATFLGGISLHVSQAILCHLFSIDMSWGATSKEAKDASFFSEIPLILRKFRLTFMFCLGMTVTIIVLSGVGPLQQVVPYAWRITEFTAIFPLAMLLALHALLPLALNPGLMQFTF